MTDTLPSDYDTQDGWDDDNGIDVCPHCELVYSPNGGHMGEVFDQSGRKYEHYLNTEPGDGPFFCPDCWDELETNRKASENNSLEDFA